LVDIFTPSRFRSYDFLFSDIAQIHDGGVFIFFGEKVSTLATNDSIATNDADCTKTTLHQVTKQGWADIHVS
jgi:hypothetical protein